MRPGGHAQLEGGVLRIVRRIQLRHRRQAARLPVGDGALGSRLRPVVLEPARPAGARGRGRGRAPLRHRAALVRPSGRPAGRRASLALTPVAALMFRFDNPDALLMLLLVGGRLRDHPGARGGQRPLAGTGRRPDRLRVPDQDAAGLPGRARRSRWSTWSPAPTPLRRRILAAARRGRRAGRRRRLVGGDRPAHARGRPPLHRRLAEQLHARADLRLQRPRPAHGHRGRQRRRRRRRVAGAGARPAGTGCSTPSSAARSPGCCPAALIALAAGLVVRRRRAAHRPHAAPRSCSGAAG